MKYLFGALYLSLSLSVSAVTENIPNKLVLNSYSNSLAKLAESEKRCDNMAIVLPHDLFEGLKLSKTEIENILFYKQHKSFLNCTQTERYKYFMSSSLLRIKSPEAIEMVDASDNINSYYFLRLLETQAEYIKIAKSKRDEIDKLKPLQHTFDLMLSLESVIKE